METMHLFIKYRNEEIEESTTIEEHIKVANQKGRFIWGHGSVKKVNGLGQSNKRRLDEQIDNSIPTFVFLSTIYKNKRYLYVGNYIASYNKGTLKQDSIQVKYIPSYYAQSVGTKEDNNITFIEVGNLVQIDEGYLNQIFLYNKPGNEKILDNKNFSSLFYVKIPSELCVYLAKILRKQSVWESTLVEELQYQGEVENTDVSSKKTEDKVKEKPEKTNSNGSSYKRNAKVSKKAIVDAKYCCEVDNSHKDFISSITKQNYVEAHHLIPMEFQDDFEVSIDVEANIVCLCVLCHKKVHHAVFKEKKAILKQLFISRKSRLEKCNIKIDEEELFRYYK